jgi:hypothetical protein
MTLRIKDTIEGKISNSTNADTVPWSGVSGKPSTFTPSSHTHDDRYYTESEVDSKLNGKANSSHTHTKSQITDFPSKLEPYFANNTWYVVGNDAAIGDHNKGGAFCVKGLNGTPNVSLYNSDNSYYGQCITTADIGSQSVSHANTAGSVEWTNVSGRPSSMPASDVYAWAKQSSKPSYTASEVGAAPASHSHSYLPLAGGTMNGPIKFNSNSLPSRDGQDFLVGIDAFDQGGTLKWSSAGNVKVGSANWANGADYANYAFSNNGVSTSGSGSAYTATVSGFSLATGKSIVMIPHVTSTTTTPTLNVSGTGAKNIRMRLSSSTSSTIPLINSSFLTQYKPVKVTYDGTYWVIDDFIQPDANHLYGTLISRGSSAPSSGTAGFIYIQTT